MEESDIQKRIKELEEQGYYVIKLKLTNKNGIPDCNCYSTKVMFYSQNKKTREKIIRFAKV